MINGSPGGPAVPLQGHVSPMRKTLGLFTASRLAQADGEWQIRYGRKVLILLPWTFWKPILCPKEKQTNRQMNKQ